MAPFGRTRRRIFINPRVEGGIHVSAKAMERKADFLMKKAIRKAGWNRVAAWTDLRAARRILDRTAARWDYPTVIVTMDSKRRLCVPVALAPAAPGDYFDVQFDPTEDTLIFRRIAPKGDWLAVLKECPVSLEEIPPRRRELPRRRKL